MLSRSRFIIGGKRRDCHKQWQQDDKTDQDRTNFYHSGKFSPDPDRKVKPYKQFLRAHFGFCCLFRSLRLLQSRGSKDFLGIKRPVNGLCRAFGGANAAADTLAASMVCIFLASPDAALTGQTFAQIPQPMHLSPTVALPRAGMKSAIALVGHLATHNPQTLHFSTLMTERFRSTYGASNGRPLHRCRTQCSRSDRPSWYQAPCPGSGR